MATREQGFVAGPLLAAVLDAQDATHALLGSADLFAAAERVVAFATDRGCEVLVAASPAAERLVGAALMRGQGLVRALSFGEDPAGIKAVVVDLVVSGVVSVATTRDVLRSRGAAHVEVAVCGTRGSELADGVVQVLA